MPQSTGPLLHLISRSEWADLDREDSYRPPSLAEEGFIHCSHPDVIVSVAGRFYAGRTDMLLLVLDAEKVAAEVVYEDSYGHGQEFPHIYGPLNLDAVAQVLEFPFDPEAGFSLPVELA